MLACSHTSKHTHTHTHTYSHSRTHKDSVAGAVSILKGLSVSISQQPCPRGCALPTLLPREELWRSANRFLLSLSCYSAPGFTPACKNQPAAEPIPSVTISFITKRAQKQRRRQEPGAESQGPELYLAAKKKKEREKGFGLVLGLSSSHTSQCICCCRANIEAGSKIPRCLAGGGLAWR